MAGLVIRFSYRVLDEAKALNDKKAEPLLFDAQAGVKLVVPQLEKVGHRTTAPEQHAKSGHDLLDGVLESDLGGETRPEQQPPLRPDIRTWMSGLKILTLEFDQEQQEGKLPRYWY